MAKYQLTQERYINGVYMYATPSEPQVVDLPAGVTADQWLQPVVDASVAPGNDPNAQGVIPDSSTVI